ncbi:unnamed protein product [Musa acuminata var. zebrina]
MEEEEEEEEGRKSPPKNQEEKPQGGGGGGWGSWGISSFSMFSDLQKAAEDISRNAVEVVKNATKGITDLEIAGSDSETTDEVSKDSRGGEEEEEEEEEHVHDRLRKSALDKLEKASEDSLFGQGLKVLDNSVETFASGAWSALGSAWKGGSSLVSKLELSAASLADSIHQGNLPGKATSFAPSVIETGKTFTTKGMEVLERVGKETMELLIAKTGLEFEKSPNEVHQEDDEEQLEEVTFDRCFYIYGGPDLLEELGALSSHYALLFNRRKAKLLAEQKSLYDAKLQQIQQIFSLTADVEGNSEDSNKGKNIETLSGDSDVEMTKLCDSSVRRAADIASGFTPVLGGLSANDIIQRATDRLDTMHSECIHRLSELCCSAVSQLLILGKSVISSANKGKNGETEGETPKIDWPEEAVSKAKIIRHKAQSMSGNMETVSNSFITGTSEIVEAYLTAMLSVSSDKQELPQSTVQEKANDITNHLRAGGATAAEKIQDALRYLAYVVLFTSMPTV